MSPPLIEIIVWQLNFSLWGTLCAIPVVCEIKQSGRLLKLSQSVHRLLVMLQILVVCEASHKQAKRKWWVPEGLKGIYIPVLSHVSQSTSIGSVSINFCPQYLPQDINMESSPVEAGGNITITNIKRKLCVGFIVYMHAQYVNSAHNCTHNLNYYPTACVG